MPDLDGTLLQKFFYCVFHIVGFAISAQAYIAHSAVFFCCLAEVRHQLSAAAFEVVANIPKHCIDPFLGSIFEQGIVGFGGIDVLFVDAFAGEGNLWSLWTLAILEDMHLVQMLQVVDYLLGIHVAATGNLAFVDGGGTVQ